MDYKVLVVDDEKGILEVIEAYLQKEGYQVKTADNGLDGLSYYMQWQPDLIILDLMLPDLSGEKICEQIRKDDDIPILMLTAKVDEDERINGLEIGADDYVTKPFSPRELVLRVKKILQRVSGSSQKTGQDIIYRDDHLLVDVEKHIISVKGEEMEVTPNEFDIMHALILNKGNVLSRDQIIMKAFGYSYEGYNRTIDTHIKNLRKKVEIDPSNPFYIKTVYGVGYRFGGE